MTKVTSCLAVALIVACLGTAQADQMWVVENQSDQVFTVDVNTLTATLVGSANVPVLFGGLGFDQSGTLYCWTTTSPGGNLYTVNQTTGSFSHIGGSTLVGGDTFDIDPITNAAIAWDVSGNLNDVNLGTGATSFRVATSPSKSGIASAFAPGGRYYQLDRSLDQLNWVDINTGAVTLVGGLGMNVNATNLAYNPRDNFLYSIEILDPSYPLYRIDPSTGAATVMGNVTGLPNDPNQQITMGTFNVAKPIPAPSTLVGLLSMGIVGLIVAWRRQRST